MAIVLQIVAAVIGLGFVAMVLWAAVYIADELERTSVRPLGRFLKAFVGGLLWGVVGIVVVAGLFIMAIIIYTIFFRPIFSFYILQFWSFRIGLLVVGLYLLWGLYHGARNRLPLSYKFRRKEPETMNNE